MTTASVLSVPDRAVARPRSLVLHQVRKDLLRHRWVLAGWCAFLTGHVWLLTAPTAGTVELGNFLGFLQDALLVALTARVMFEDPLAGPGNAFWRTLPLPRPTLLAAKLILLGLLVWLPTLVAQLACLLSLALPGSLVLPAVLQSAVWQAALIAAFALLASMMNGYVRYFGVVILGTVGPWLALLALWRKLGPGAPHARLAEIPSVPLLALVAIAALSALAWRYLARPGRQLRWTWIAVVVVLLSFWTVAMSATSTFHRGAGRFAPRDEALRAVLDQPVDLTRPRPEVAANMRDGGRGNDIAGTFVFPKPIAGYRLMPGRIRSLLQFGEGPAWTYSAPDEVGWSSIGGPRAHELALGLEPGGAREDAVSFTRPILEVPIVVGDRGEQRGAGTFSADVTFDAYRYDRGPELAVKRGASATLGQVGFQILGVKITPRDGLVIEARTNSVLVPHPAPESRRPMAFWLRLTPDREPVLLGHGRGMTSGRLIAAWPFVRRQEIELPLDAGRTMRALNLTEAGILALRDARLLISYETYVGSTEREFRVEKFRPAEW